MDVLVLCVSVHLLVFHAFILIPTGCRIFISQHQRGQGNISPLKNKLILLHVNNKDTDQPAYSLSLIAVPSLFTLLKKYNTCSLKCSLPNFNILDWFGFTFSETPKILRFSHVRAPLTLRPILSSMSVFAGKLLSTWLHVISQEPVDRF